MQVPRPLYPSLGPCKLCSCWPGRVTVSKSHGKFLALNYIACAFWSRIGSMINHLYFKLDLSQSHSVREELLLLAWWDLWFGTSVFIINLLCSLICQECGSTFDNQHRPHWLRIRPEMFCQTTSFRSRLREVMLVKDCSSDMQSVCFCSCSMSYPWFSFYLGQSCFGSLHSCFLWILLWCDVISIF